MDLVFYLLARGLLGLIQRLPLTLVARLGRAGGEVFYWLDARHRRVARDNLRQALGQEYSPRELRALARENFRRIGENFASAAKTATMSAEAIGSHLEFRGLEKMVAAMDRMGRGGCIGAIGHFGNFELYARGSGQVPGFQFATTYRGLDHPRLDRLLQGLRQRSGCRYFERRREAALLRQALQNERLMLGLLVDQHAGRSGLLVPFFGRPCVTSTAPALLALRYRLPLFTAICYRTRLAHWRVEIGDEIPLRDAQGSPRSVAELTRDINLAFETAIRHDPANWFWVHRRWKLRPGKTRKHRSAGMPAADPEAPASPDPIDNV